jgi:hypothetical protein
MLAYALAALLLTTTAEPASGSSGFAGRGLGVEMNGSVAIESASGTLESRGILLPQWELGLRLRIGQFLSIGASVEYLHAIIGGAGDDWDYERKQVAADVQWRFWGYRGLIRPWVGLGMAWGQIHAYHRDESLPGVDTHVWEYFRASVGFDVVIGDTSRSDPGSGSASPAAMTSTLRAPFSRRTSSVSESALQSPEPRRRGLGLPGLPA